MAATPINVGEQIYEAKVKFTNMIEFGVSMEALVSGKTPPPPEGARFDVAFEGSTSGPELKGKISGVDYLSVRADGRFELHIHGVISTQDGANISFFADGVAIPRKGSPLLDLRENVTMRTSSPLYSWVNLLQIWAQGTVDVSQQEVHVKGFVA